MTNVNWRKRRWLAIALLGAGVGVAAAETSSPPAAGASKQREALNRLVGNWRGKVERTAEGATSVLEATISCERIAAGHGVSCRARFAGGPGAGAIEETDLFGYDATTGVYHWYVVNSAGDVHDHAGALADDGGFSWTYQGTSSGRPLQETSRMSFDPKGARVRFRTELVVDGKSASVLAGALTRR